jgi:hypothetical protein
MESSGPVSPSADEARLQLSALDNDRRWARIVSWPWTGYDANICGPVIVSLLLVGIQASRSLPHRPDVGFLAYVNMFVVLYGIGRTLNRLTGSWRGVRGSRPTWREVCAAVAAFVAAFVVVVWSGREHIWPVVVLASAGGGLVWLDAARRWLTRCRGDAGYQPGRRAYAMLPIYIVTLTAVDIGIAYAVLGIFGRQS